MARRTIMQRLDAKLIRDENGCLIWQGSTMRNGYGQAWDGTRVRAAHRVYYEACVGPVDPALDLDHLCRVRLCCEPTHLEPVTRGENLRRAAELAGSAWRAVAAENAAKTHCKNGHEFTESNTYRHVTTGSRCCRECTNARVREHNRRKREAA